MDESFQDSINISDLFKPSILKLEDIFMPCPTNFGIEFDKVRHSSNDDIILTSTQSDNINSNQQTDLNSEAKSKFPEYKSASTQFSDDQNKIDSNLPP